MIRKISQAITTLVTRKLAFEIDLGYSTEG